MGLDHILLGVLREPSSGYDIKIWFERAFRHFWAAEPSQIYRTLARLLASGLLSSHEEASDKGPPRRIYRITAKGRKSLGRWLRSGPSFSDSRQSQLAQLLFLAELPDDASRLAFLDAMHAEYRHRLSELLEVRGTLEIADFSDTRNHEEFFRLLTLDAGIHQYQCWVTWTDRARSLLAQWIAEDGATQTMKGSKR